MNEKTYFLVNPFNVVDNCVIWDEGSDWVIPDGHQMLETETTPAMVWKVPKDATEYALTEVMGEGQIGFTWNGTVLTTAEPKPPYIAPAPQPISTGTQTL